MTDTYALLGRFAIAADHPCLPGHFPGRPVVPGVVLLDHALTLVLPPPARAAALPLVKFTAVVRPGEAVDVLARETGHGRIDFIAQRSGEVVLRGCVVPAA